MTFRTRLLLAFAALAVIPLSVFAFGVRREMEGRLTDAFERRGETLVAAIGRDVEREGASIAGRLRALAASLPDDERLRLALVHGDPAQRAYRIDWAGRAMRLAGLSVLRLQDGEGRILSSGHFRAEFDRLDPSLPAGVSAVRGAALARVRTPTGVRPALLRAEPVALGGRRLVLLGGTIVDPEFLIRLSAEPDLEVWLEVPAGGAEPPAPPRTGVGERNGAAAVEAVGEGGRAVRELPVPFVGDDGGGEAALVVSWSLAPLRDARRDVDRWFVAGLGIVAAAALGLAGWLSRRLGRPLAELARKTARVDLDRLDVDFGSRRRDEIGALSRLLAAMTERLRASAGRLREAERRATLGEIARQVNHDIRNGLVPLRNVFRHLLETAGREPAQVAAVLAERRGTIESGIAYLEDLASSYARLSPRLEPRALDANAVAREVAAVAAPGAHAGPAPERSESAAPRLRLELSEGLPAVRADPLALRRILENLVGNALDSVRETGGEVVLSTSPAPPAGRARGAGADGARIRFTVSDTGPGIGPEELERIFEDFYTTKAGGTGLGLSVVRRLVGDLGGTLRVDSGPGRGARFIVELEAEGRPS